MRNRNVLLPSFLTASVVFLGGTACSSPDAYDPAQSDGKILRSEKVIIPSEYTVERCFSAHRGGVFYDRAHKEIKSMASTSALLQNIVMSYLGVSKKAIVNENVYGFGSTARNATAYLAEKHKVPYEDHALPLSTDGIGFRISSKPKASINDGAVITHFEPGTFPVESAGERARLSANFGSLAELDCNSMGRKVITIIQSARE